MANVTLFSQIIGKLNKDIFKKLVKAKQTDKYHNACGYSHSALTGCELSAAALAAHL